MIPIRPPTKAAALEWFSETLRFNGESRAPLCVFKFLSPKSEHFEKNLRAAFLHSSVYLSPKRIFNDPFDTAVHCDLGTPEDQRAYLCEVSRRNGDGLDFESSEFQRLADWYFSDGSFGRDTERNLARMGICSFSADVESLLMWAHYADAHRGVALIFNLHNDVAHFDAVPVRYQQKFSRISPSTRAIDELLFYGPLHKGADWKHEKEWRVIKPLGAETSYNFHHSLFWSVIHGMECEESTVKLVAQLALERVRAGLMPPHLYDARHRRGNYALDFFERIPVKRPHPIDFKQPLPAPPQITSGRPSKGRTVGRVSG